MVKKILIAGFIVRVFCGAVLFHPDIKSQYFHAQFLSKGVTDIYSFVESSKSELPYTDTFNYPPLTYILLGGWYSIANQISQHSIQSWINDWSNDSQKDNYQLFSNLLLLKFPYFLSDVLVIILLLKFFTKASKNIAFLWAFNPLLLYGVYAVGQFDIIPALCLLTSLILFSRNKPIWAGVILAIATGIKGYPLLVAPIFILGNKSMKSRLSFTLAYIFTVLLIFTPFINNKSFLASQASAGLITRLLEVNMFNVPLIIPAIVVVLISLFFKYGKKNIFIYSASLSTLVLVLASIKFHGQWGVWVAGLMIPFLVRSKFLTLTFTVWVLFFFAYIFTLPDTYVLLGLLTPISYFLSQTPSIISHLPLVAEKTIYLRVLYGAVSLIFIIVLILNDRSKINNYILSKFPVQLATLACLSLVVFSIVSSVFLVKRVNEISQFTVDRFVPIIPSKPIVQTFSVKNKGLSEVVVFMRNPQVKNTDPLTLEIQDDDSNTLREVAINGRNIGDGVDVPFKFTPVLSDLNEFKILIKVPKLVDQPSRIEVGFSNNNTLIQGSSTEPGDLSFQTFYTPSSKLEMAKSIISSFMSNMASVQLLLVVTAWFIAFKCLLVSFDTSRDI